MTRIMDILRNRSRELKGLVYNSLRRKDKEKRSYGNVSNIYCNGVDGIYRKNLNRGRFVVHFYEWSDPNRIPRNFSSFTAFTKFLGESGIPIVYWEENLVKSLETCYVTCERGSKKLIIRSTYSQLLDAVERK